MEAHHRNGHRMLDTCRYTALAPGPGGIEACEQTGHVSRVVTCTQLGISPEILSLDYPPRGPRLGGQHTWVLVTRYVIGGGGGGHTVAVPLEKLIALELDQVAQHQVPAMENISTMCPLTVT